MQSNGDAPLELKMSMPKVTGGKGDGQNPEQLFAMGYACTSSHYYIPIPPSLISGNLRAACFLGAVQLSASRAQRMDIVDNAKVHTRVFLGHPTDPNMNGFGLRVKIDVEGCDDDAIITAAHEVRIVALWRENWN